MKCVVAALVLVWLGFGLARLRDAFAFVSDVSHEKAVAQVAQDRAIAAELARRRDSSVA